ncbi:hypothetical protein N7493_010978 [Penicillium malachiteum]|uniref:Uncharacterized protein n=1 Tax=Penicillium malachiteum TaxID=1324776 RepID=A0AAD6HB99_9EURO|nr:hypothetical protein N7493_010978 [Penicillium malachiteum]
MQYSIFALVISLAATNIAAPAPKDEEIVNVGDIIAAKRDPTPEENVGVSSPGNSGITVGSILKRGEATEDNILPDILQVAPVNI